jgi:hypothetical protein
VKGIDTLDEFGGTVTETEVLRIEHPVHAISLGKDAVVVQCTDGTTFDLSVGQCEHGAGFRITTGAEEVVEEGHKCTFRFSYSTTSILSQWASKWPG